VKIIKNFNTLIAPLNFELKIEFRFLDLCVFYAEDSESKLVKCSTNSVQKIVFLKAEVNQ
jgi:hypothetical protein